PEQCILHACPFSSCKTLTHSAVERIAAASKFRRSAHPSCAPIFMTSMALAPPIAAIGRQLLSLHLRPPCFALAARRGGAPVRGSLTEAHQPIRKLLLVAAAIRLPHQSCSVPRVKSNSTFIGLKNPEVQAGRCVFPDHRQQSAADRLALIAWMNIEAAQIAFMKPGVRHHGTINLSHPNAVARHDNLAHPIFGGAERMHSRHRPCQSAREHGSPPAACVRPEWSA